MIDVQLKIIDPRIGTKWPIPRYETAGAAGIDMIACLDEPLTLPVGSCALIGSGIAIHIDNPGYAAVLLPRSGLGALKGVVLGNSVGLIDSDYQGQIKIAAWNRNRNKEVEINPGDKIAQLVIMPVIRALFTVVSAFDNESHRGAGGFGSTDAIKVLQEDDGYAD